MTLQRDLGVNRNLSPSGLCEVSKRQQNVDQRTELRSARSSDEVKKCREGIENWRAIRTDLDEPPCKNSGMTK
jgi:hypothetical protein